MAAAIGGMTIHSAADLGQSGQAASRSLNHSDVENLFIQNQYLRWVLLDEISMVADELLGEFEAAVAGAARATQFSKRADKSQRIFGGYNFVCFGDWWQLPPIPDTAALFKPPSAKSSRKAKTVLNLFWGDDPDSLNYMKELTEQKRVVDHWYNDFLSQCRDGQLQDEMYHFICGLPTEHCGTWKVVDGCGLAACENAKCNQLAQVWQAMAGRGATWEEMVKEECVVCAEERKRRNRVVTVQDPRVRTDPFLHAPYVHRNNEPKYHALLVRAMEHAKRGASGPKHVSWVAAFDRPVNPEEVTGAREQVVVFKRADRKPKVTKSFISSQMVSMPRVRLER